MGSAQLQSELVAKDRGNVICIVVNLKRTVASWQTQLNRSLTTDRSESLPKRKMSRIQGQH